MSDDPRPSARAYVTVADQRYELVPTDKLTWPEVKEAKRVSGMPLVDMEHGLAKADADAWFAWLYVSIRRQQPKLTEQELERAIGDTPIVAIIESVEEEAPEVAAPDPPALPSTSESGVEKNGDASGEKTQLSSILETAGPRT